MEADEEKQRISTVSKSIPLRKSALLEDSNHRSMDPHGERLWKKLIGKPYPGKPTQGCPPEGDSDG
jgi:hypothetical protein